MLRMMLLGLLIPLGVGVLSAMELRTPPRNAAAVVLPVAETTPDVSDLQGVLAKADRLEIVAAGSEAPAPPAPAAEFVAPPEEASIAPSEPSTLIDRDRRDLNPTKFSAAARVKSNPKTLAKKTLAMKTVAIKTAAMKPSPVKPTAIAQRSRATGGTEPCRLRAFGGLLRALNSTDCDI